MVMLLQLVLTVGFKTVREIDFFFEFSFIFLPFTWRYTNRFGFFFFSIWDEIVTQFQQMSQKKNNLVNVRFLVMLFFWISVLSNCLVTYFANAYLKQKKESIIEREINATVTNTVRCKWLRFYKNLNIFIIADGWLEIGCVLSLSLNIFSVCHIFFFLVWKYSVLDFLLLFANKTKEKSITRKLNFTRCTGN